MDQQEVKAKIQQLNDEAYKRAKDNGVELDFTNESVTTVEAILLEMFEEAQGLDLTEQDYERMAEVWGAYLGESLIRNLGKGYWDFDQERKAYVVRLDDLSVYFPTEVYQVLKSGLVENVIDLYIDVYNQHSPVPIQL
ncbi:MAG: hypothetical protein ACD_57C00311G0002 [uncultured bacterium]|uniref:DUF3806 domain-containing protein n=1 Tax=Candidatus Woesebacteria bacterium RIFCSPHIGHO2_12_FULL_41_24 TaxID=1802510 RepID=A0A1F8AUG3_9BACT|nr:MAG: hypothetical protein ACD_57C00311G0002 [uncultured bacterium]OGM14703.1 MAG: hypothetical protein A2W15_01935 [Candidatus Woesebacteria bacterium RBG_16_41_13]OGM29717.1 MAG: hypothetical protein A2873_02355 [Candidatus Woesebacteria bacterium RIFCSPHIGHO2_01_FULL_42_80]OGM35245.1 MAG: hypothetical protein A3D84_00435 [Candidatus Woesebacteria bacterium RIFCSPHIGHO2_02_FULL_42_20]OGM55139.1 MAG: hypothetical protein A3E44_04440 [Candidatus Woesebacteria bacterium RIFCSPHIGHO2_12_FULL_41